MMLHAVPLKRSRAAVIHVHRQSDSNRAFGIYKAFTMVLIDASFIGDDPILIGGYLENVVVVNRHKRALLNIARIGKFAISAAPVAASNRNVRRRIGKTNHEFTRMDTNEEKLLL